MWMPNKIGFREKKVTRDREGHYIIIERSITKKTQQS